MVQWHGRSKRQTTGGRVKYARKKRKYEMGRPFGETRTGKEKKKSIRTRGGNSKIRLLRAEFANIINPESQTCQKLFRL